MCSILSCFSCFFEHSFHTSTIYEQYCSSAAIILKLAVPACWQASTLLILNEQPGGRSLPFLAPFLVGGRVGNCAVILGIPFLIRLEANFLNPAMAETKLRGEQLLDMSLRCIEGNIHEEQ